MTEMFPGAGLLLDTDQGDGKCEGKVSRGVQLFLHMFPSRLHSGNTRDKLSSLTENLSQIVALTVYSYFMASLLGLQYIESRDSDQDYYFPFFGSLQFVFYVGWLKVAESLINPFGEVWVDFLTDISQRIKNEILFTKLYSLN